MSHNLTKPDALIPPELIDLRQVTPEQFEQLCSDYRDLRFELTSSGELIVMPPTSPLMGTRNSNLTYQIEAWARKDATGLCFAANAGFTLPNNAIRSPDASWIRRERWDALTPQQKDRFSPICPDFVVELRSRTDSLPVLLRKMEEYIANGASLGWLIDPSTLRVHVYRPNQEVIVLESPESVSGEALLPGFTLNVMELW